MSIFTLTLGEMIYFFTLILVGYLVGKIKLFEDNFDGIISKFLSFVVTPALIVENFYEKFKIDILVENIFVLLAGLVSVVILHLVAIGISRFFTKDNYVKKIYKYSFTNANFGYMGYVLVEALFGADALFNMIVFTIPFNTYAFTIGINSFNPENTKASLKSIFTPVTISLIIGALLGLSGIVLPEFLAKTLSGVSGTMGVLAMIVTGFIISKYKISDVIKDYRIYLASVVRLVVIPAFVVLLMSVFNIDKNIIMIALCTTAMPFGLNGVIFPAAYGQDTKTGAGMALISDILAVITIPVMFAFFL